MPNCLFAADLHGRTDRYAKLFARIEKEVPAAVFLGGDLLPPGGVLLDIDGTDFVENYLFTNLASLRHRLADRYPQVFAILGNDDPRCFEPLFRQAETDGLLRYVHGNSVDFADFRVCGCSYVPPTPFLLKDWERYDVSRYVDPGCVSPEEGYRSVAAPENEIRWTTILSEMSALLAEAPSERTILLAHVPPYDTALDRAALDGQKHDHVLLDVHIGSIAIRRLIEQRQPRVTLHGHVHESTRLTGSWQACIGRTVCFNAAHDGPELALVRFDPETPQNGTRELI